MKMKFILFLLLVSSTITGQEVILGDSIKIKIKKYKLRRTKGVIIDVNKNKAKKKNRKKLYVYCLIESLNNKKVKIDAFTLVDETNKLRYRAIDFIGSKGRSWAGTNFQNDSYLKTEILDSKGKSFTSLPNYDSTKKDFFYDYSIKGYENVEVPIFFGQNNQQNFADMFKKKKYLSSVVYFSEAKYETFLASFYFPITVNKNIEYVFYYGDKPLTKLKL